MDSAGVRDEEEGMEMAGVMCVSSELNAHMGLYKRYQRGWNEGRGKGRE